MRTRSWVPVTLGTHSSFSGSCTGSGRDLGCLALVVWKIKWPVATQEAVQAGQLVSRDRQQVSRPEANLLMNRIRQHRQKKWLMAAPCTDGMPLQLPWHLLAHKPLFNPCVSLIRQEASRQETSQPKCRMSWVYLKLHFPLKLD